MNVIEVNNLTKQYGNTLANNKVNLSIKEGEIFGFIGPNGAGKSTTIRILLNLLFPTSGSATIFGYDVIKDSEKIKSNIGYLSSDVNFYQNMTVKELLTYSEEFYSISDSIYTNSLCERFQLDVSRELNELSMGNKKKVAIVQAFLHKPDLIIMDEPTNGLDPLMQSIFFDLVNRIQYF